MIILQSGENATDFIGEWRSLKMLMHFKVSRFHTLNSPISFPDAMYLPLDAYAIHLTSNLLSSIV